MTCIPKDFQTFFYGQFIGVQAYTAHFADATTAMGNLQIRHFLLNQSQSVLHGIFTKYPFAYSQFAVCRLPVPVLYCTCINRSLDHFSSNPNFKHDFTIHIVVPYKNYFTTLNIIYT